MAAKTTRSRRHRIRSNSSSRGAADILAVGALGVAGVGAWLLSRETAPSGGVVPKSLPINTGGELPAKPTHDLDVGPRKHFSAKAVTGPSLTVRADAPVAYRSVDELLASCPTRDDIVSIRNDFNISFSLDALAEDDASSSGGPWCTSGGSEHSLMLGLYNLFRIAKFVVFDEPIPMLGTTSVYQWAKDNRLVFNVFSGTPGRYRGECGPPDSRGTFHGSCAMPGQSGIVYINSDNLRAPWTRVGLDAAAGVGAYALPGVIVHEGWHAVSGKHHDMLGRPGWTAGHCEDSSLDYGGAWAASYWYMRWLAEHSGTYLSSAERANAAHNAEYILSTRICRR